MGQIYQNSDPIITSSPSYEKTRSLKYPIVLLAEDFKKFHPARLVLRSIEFAKRFGPLEYFAWYGPEVTFLISFSTLLSFKYLPLKNLLITLGAAHIPADSKVFFVVSATIVPKESPLRTPLIPCRLKALMLMKFLKIPMWGF